MTDEAYANAWSYEYALSRFEKRRSIILARHFRKLSSLEQLKDEKGFQKLLDKSNGFIGGLKAEQERKSWTMPSPGL